MVVRLALSALSLLTALLLAHTFTPPLHHTSPHSTAHFAKKSPRIRIDELLVRECLASDTEHAMRLVLARSVIVNEGEVVTSPATLISTEAKIRLKTKDKPFGYVSRSANKLAHAIQVFDLSARIRGAICIDIGSSTGGFTQVLVENGAAKVFAVDVGVSILDYKLRIHPSVVVCEKVNARYLSIEHIPDAGTITAVVCDVSFISLRLVLPPALLMCSVGATLVALIKPQFECDREDVGEGGIVRDESIRTAVVQSTLDWFAAAFPSWSVAGTVESPITGTHGNQEYLLVATKTT